MRTTPYSVAVRVFPYPHAPVRIPPLEGRLVLFEPRMVHDVLPSWHKRCCFTLWCHAVDLTASPTAVDHGTLDAITVAPDMCAAAALAEGWRTRMRMPLPYDDARMPPALRALFLPELRPWLVRAMHMEEELAQTLVSHDEGAARDAMAEGIGALHAAIREANPPWLLALVRALTEARELCDAEARRADAEADAAIARRGGEAAPPLEPPVPLSLAELKRLVHRHSPWWG